MRQLAIIFSVVVILIGCKNTQKIPISETKIEGEKNTETPEIVTPLEEQPIEVETELEPIEEIVQEIPEIFNHQSFDTLLRAHVSVYGVVDYVGFMKDKQILLAYIASLGEKMPEKNWTKEDKLAYWMNAYNAMTVDLILRNYPLKSIKDINKPWNQRLWKLDDKLYNLDEIEHQILRKMDDPRIHFGINCASFSCPPLLNEAFTSKKVDTQLDVLTKNFINDTSRNTISENAVIVSKIFNWFGKDFKTEGSLVDFLNKYSTISIYHNAKVRYKDYNWSLNN